MLAAPGRRADRHQFSQGKPKTLRNRRQYPDDDTGSTLTARHLYNLGYRRTPLPSGTNRGVCELLISYKPDSNSFTAPAAAERGIERSLSSGS